MKRLISSILATLLALMLLIPGAAWAEGEPEFTIDSYDGILKGYSGPGGDVTVPDYIGNIPVLSVDSSAFSGSETVTSLTFKSPRLNVLHYGALSRMTQLERVQLPDSLVAISYACFQNNPVLTRVTVPPAVRFVGSSSFFSCDQLKSVIFTGIAPRIEHDCFHWLPEDFVVYVPDDCYDDYRAQIDEEIAVEPSGKNAVHVDMTTPEERFAFDPETGTITGYKGFDIDISIPQAIGGVPVKAIGEGAFKNIRYAFVVEIPEGVEVIGKEAFTYTSKLGWVQCPDSVREIGEAAFKAGIHGDSFDWPAGLTTIGKEAFSYTSLSKDLYLPENLETIGEEAFSHIHIYNLYLPGSVKAIGPRAFADNYIRYMAFDLYEPIDIADNAFENCNDLEDLDLPWDCSQENQQAYAAMLAEQAPNCYVWINNPTDCEYPEKGEYLFEKGEDGFYYLTEFTSDQETLMLWHTIRDDSGETIPAIGLGDGVFKGNQTLKKFRATHSDKFTTIGAEAFEDSAVETVDLYYTTEVIGAHAFKNCKNLRQITLPASLKSVGEGAFEGCENLETVTVLCDPAIFPEDAFAGCDALVNVSTDAEMDAEETMALKQALGLNTGMPAEWMDAYGGDWYLNTVTMDQGEFSAADIGMEATLTFNPDGTAVMDVDGLSEGTWTVDGDALIVTSDGMDIAFTLANDMLVSEEEGTTMVFGRGPARPGYVPGEPLEAESAADFDGTWRAFRVNVMDMSLPVETLGDSLRDLIGLDTLGVEIRGTDVRWEGADSIDACAFEDGQLKLYSEAGSADTTFTLLDDGNLRCELNGGVLYFQRVSDESTLPEPEPEPVLPQAAPVSDEDYALYGGQWFLTGMNLEGQDINPADMGLAITLTLNADGTAEMTSPDGDKSYTWRVEGGSVLLSSADETIELRGADASLVGEDKGSVMIFDREAPEAEPVPETVPAADISDFDGSWIARSVSAYGMKMPMTDDTIDQLKTLLGAEHARIDIEDGRVSWFGADTEDFEFMDGRLQCLTDIESIEPGALDEFIDLLEDGGMRFQVLGMTFFCERAEGEPEPAPEAARVPETGMRYALIDAEVSGYHIDPAALGGEYAVTFNADGSLGFTVAGSPLTGLTWHAENGAVLVDYYDGETLRFEPDGDALTLDYFGAMTLRFAAE